MPKSLMITPTESTRLQTVSAVMAEVKEAMRFGMLARNPAELVTPPRIEERELQSWDVDQVARFLLVVESDHNAALWQLAILVGLRRGELLGLKWEDLDLDRGTLSVARTYSRTATSGWGTSRRARSWSATPGRCRRCRP